MRTLLHYHVAGITLVISLFSFGQGNDHPNKYVRKCLLCFYLVENLRMFGNISFHTFILTVVSIIIYPQHSLSVYYITVEYRCNVVQQIFRAYSSCLTETLCCLINNSPFPLPPAQPLVTIIPVFDFMNLTLYMPHICGIMQFLSFRVWLISLNIMPTTSIRVVIYCRISFVGLKTIPWYAYATFS